MGEAALALDRAQNDTAMDPRRAPRATVYATVDLCSEHNFWSGLTMNMSEGGLFVATHHCLRVGTMLHVHISLPFENEPVVVLAEVRWTRGYSGQDDVPPGVGMRFVNADASSLAKIRRFVATVREPIFFDD